jgi:hypothetical protein
MNHDWRYLFQHFSSPANAIYSIYTIRYHFLYSSVSAISIYRCQIPYISFYHIDGG